MQETAQLRDAHASSLSAAAATSSRYELSFRPLAEIGCSYAFPCDADGRVLMDALSSRALANYLYARAMVGHELQWPQVRRVA